MARFTTGSDLQDTLPIAAPAPEAKASRAGSTYRAGSKPFPNKYGAKCVDCGVYVEEGEGNTRKSAAGKWEVRHNQPCPTEAEAAPAVVSTDAPKATPAVAFKVPNGRYTISWDEHRKTIRVQTQGEFEDFMPGVTILKFLSGSNNDRDYTSFGHVAPDGTVRIWRKHQANPHLREAVKVLLGDPQAASKAYAQESGECGVCGRTLTTPESIDAGIGPECAKRVQW